MAVPHYRGDIKKPETERSGVFGIMVPAGDVVLQFITRALWIGTGGDLTIQLSQNPPGTSVTLRNIPDGTLLPLSVVKIFGSTTAADIVAIT